MAGVEIDTDSDEFQAWYQAFTMFPPVAIFESQHKSVRFSINILKNQRGPSVRNRVITMLCYRAQRRDVKIALQNKLAKVKYKL
jgi:hypothetical protein